MGSWGAFTNWPMGLGLGLRLGLVLGLGLGLGLALGLGLGCSSTGLIWPPVYQERSYDFTPFRPFIRPS